MGSLQDLFILSFLSLIITSFAQVSFATVKVTKNHEIVGTVDPSLKEWCNGSSYPHLCVATVAPFINGKPTLHSALDVAIQTAIRYTNKTMSVAKDVAKAPPPDTKMVVDDAIENLDSALSSYQKAQNLLKQKRYDEMNNEISAASGAFTTAVDPYGPDPNAEEIKVPVLRDMLHKNGKLASVCLTFTNLLAPVPV